MADETKLVVNGKEYIMPTTFTLGEARMVKKLTGRAMDDFDNLSGADPDWIVALLWIAMHRDNPTLTIEDIESLTFDEITIQGDTEGEQIPPEVQPTPKPPESETPTAANGKSDSATLLPVTSPDDSGLPS